MARERRTRAAPVALVILLATVFGISTAHAAQPRWATVAADAYVILPHALSPSPQWADEGIWRFDPGPGTYQRLRPFAFNPTSFDLGRGSFLSTIEDRLLFQSWPAYIEFDVATMRVIRRYSPLSDPTATFYFIQGPALDPGSALAVGMLPGIYGFQQCWWNIHTVMSTGPVSCPSYVFPGADPSAPWIATILRRGVEADDGSARLFADLSSNPPEQSYRNGWTGTFFSFDPNRKGFWSGGGQTVSFYPIRAGAIRAEDRVQHPLPPSLADPSWPWEVDSFFYHPARDQFLVVTRGSRDYAERRFFALNRNLEVVASYGTFSPSPEGPKDRIPLTFAAFPALAPSLYTQTVPIVVHAPGRRATFWVTDLWLFNPSAETTIVSIRRITAPAFQRDVELPAHGSLKIPDALTWVGGGPNGDASSHDALCLTSPYRWGEQVVAVARSFTPSPDAELRARGGTVGHGVPAVPGRLGYTNHLIDLPLAPYDGTVGTDSSLGLDRRRAGQFRHNLGIVNPGDQPALLKLWWGTGDVLELFVPAHSVEVKGLESVLPPEAQSRARLYLGGTPAIVWLSMVDNTSGDATLVPYSQFGLVADDDTRLAIPAIAHLTGVGGAEWRTDLYPGGSGLSAWFHPAWPDRNCGGAVARGGELNGTLAEQGEASGVVGDVIGQFAPCQGDEAVRGGLELRLGTWMSAYARNYVTRPDGGTYGDILPLYPPHGWPVQHFAGIEVSPQFRVNLGLFNGDKDHSITHRLTLYASDGTLVAQRELVLKPWENLNERLERLFGLQVGSLPNGTYGLTVLPLDDPANGVEGRSWAFVSLVDNITNDPTHWW